MRNDKKTTAFDLAKVEYVPACHMQSGDSIKLSGQDRLVKSGQQPQASLVGTNNLKAFVRMRVSVQKACRGIPMDV